MAGGGAGLAMGRAIFQEPSPAAMAQRAGRDRARPVILTIDLGHQRHQGRPLGPATGWWPGQGSAVDTGHPAPGWAEQDPSSWWASVVAACAEVGRAAGRPASGPVDGDRVHRGPPDLRPWSTPAASRSGRRSCGRTGGPGPRPSGWPPGRRGRGRARPAPAGIPLDGGIGGGQDRLAGRPPGRAPGRQRLAPDPAGPRRLAADRRGGHRRHHGLAQSGLYDLDGQVVEELAGPAAAKLPPVVPSDQVTGAAGGRRPAAALGLAGGHAGGDRRRRPGLRGARHRGRRESCPMVSWGTTANVSVPVAERPARRPPGMVLSQGGRRRLAARGRALGGRVVPGLARPAHRPPARSSWPRWPRRARPVPGAWWPPPGWTGPGPPGGEPEAGAAFVGLGSAPRTGRSGPGRLRGGGLGGAAAAWTPWRPGGPAGRRRPGSPWPAPGAAIPVWLDVLTGITGLPVRPPPFGPGRLRRRRPAGRRRRSDAGWDLDRHRSGRGPGRHPIRRWSTGTPGSATASRPGGRGRDRLGARPAPPATAGRHRRAADPGLRRRRAGRSTCPTTPWWSSAQEPAAAGRRGGAPSAGRWPPRCPARPLGRSGRARGTGWPWSSPTSPGRCPTPPCCRRCWPSSNGRGRPRPGRAAVRHRDPPPGHRRTEMAAAGRRGPRGPLPDPRPPGRRRRPRRRWGRSTGARSCSTATTSRPTSAS